jgi:hypothetical protein
VGTSRHFSTPSGSARVRSVGLLWRRRTSYPEPVAPTPSYSVARQGPTSLLTGWASQIRTRVNGQMGRWAHCWRDQSNNIHINHLHVCGWWRLPSSRSNRRRYRRLCSRVAACLLPTRRGSIYGLSAGVGVLQSWSMAGATCRVGYLACMYASMCALRLLSSRTQLPCIFWLADSL